MTTNISYNKYSSELLLVLLLALIGVFILLGFTTREHNHQICSGINIVITDSESASFINEADVNSVIYKYVDAEPVGTEIYHQDLQSIEKELRDNPFVKTAETYFDNNGELHIEILQRRPIIRIINSQNVSYYIDSEGFKAPLSNQFTARVPILSGHILDNGNVHGKVERSSMMKIFEFAKLLDENAFWNAQIEQIHIDDNSEAILIPKVGNHEILIGELNDMDELEEKLEKVLTFYKEGLSRLGWEVYKTIDVRFDKQVIGVKKEIEK